MKKYIFLLGCLAISLVTMSQKAVISFEEKSHDFGKVNEEDGKITYVFDFINKGNAPLVVNRVQASCGCTTPTWTKEPIEPGKKGSVTVTYNPLGRPGPFTKPITVFSNASDEQLNLTIRGEVIQKQTAENSAYPVNMGGLQLSLKMVAMNNVEKGRTQTRTLNIQNATKSPVKVSIENLPSYISYTVSPETLKAEEEGKITFTFNSKNISQWGPFSDDAYLSLNGVKRFSDEFKLTILGNVIEDFGKLTLDQKRKAPIFEISERIINLGVIKQKSKRVGKFKISNKGQNALEIRRIINNNKDLAVRLSKSSVANGKATEITVEPVTKNMGEGPYNKTITIQTNDPDNSFVILTINWEIKK